MPSPTAPQPVEPSEPSVTLDVRTDRIAVMTINQTAARANLLTDQLWHELDTAVTPLAGRPDLKGLIITGGKPDGFLAGADLKFFATVSPNDPTTSRLVELGLSVLAKLERLPFPTCAAIDGPALGGGFELALACDYRVAGTSPRVSLGLPEVKMGLIPGWGGIQRLQRIIGTMNTAALIEDGHSIDAEQAMLGGMVEAVADSAGLLNAAAKLLLTRSDWKAIRFNKGGSVTYNPKKDEQPAIPGEPIAAREAVAVLVHGADLSLHDAIALNTEAFLRLAGSEQSREKIAAFFESRSKPNPAG